MSYIKVTIETSTNVWSLLVREGSGRPLEEFRNCIVGEFDHRWQQAFGLPAQESEA